MVSRVIHKPDIQTILRYLVDFASRSPLHGLNYLARKNIHWCEFIYWILALLCMLIFGFKCGIELLITYKSRNSAITCNVNYMKINTLYPTVTVCPEQILDPEKVRAFISTQSFLQNNEDKQQFGEFLEKLSTINGRKAYSFEMSFGHFPSDDYMETIFNLSKVYNVNIHGRFAIKVMTLVGICYMFNNYLEREMNTENWFDPKPFPSSMSRTLSPALSTFNFSHSYPIEIEMEHNITGNMTIYVHSPYDMPTTWTRAAAVLNQDEAIKMIVSVKEITYEKNLLSETNVNERRCRTNVESNLFMFPSTYSQNLCLMECRANYSAYICHCIPHIYRNRNIANLLRVPICRSHGLKCYAQFLQLFRNIYSNSKSDVFKCDCYPNCISQILVSKVYNTAPPRSNKSNIVIAIDYPPLESYQRSVMYSSLDYAVTLFTVMSAFLGFSILSLCDFVYFFTVRLFWFRRGYRGSVDNQ